MTDEDFEPVHWYEDRDPTGLAWDFDPLHTMIAFFDERIFAASPVDGEITLDLDEILEPCCATIKSWGFIDPADAGTRQAVEYLEEEWELSGGVCRLLRSQPVVAVILSVFDAYWPTLRRALSNDPRYIDGSSFRDGEWRRV